MNPVNLTKPGQALDVAAWPGGIEPVRNTLDPESMRALAVEPSAENRALRLADDLAEDELGQSAFVRNALILLEEIGGEDTVWATNDGRLNKASVARMRALMSWPGMEATEQYRAGKKYYEQLVGELHLLRLLAKMAGLIEPGVFWFELTPLGRSMLELGSRGALQALLFRQAFWHADLSQFVSGRPRKLPGWWPQGDIGAVLWSMSAVADGVAKCGHPDGVMHGSRRQDADGGALESGGHDVRAAHPRSAALVWAGGVSGAGGLVRRSVAQDRAIRPLPVVRSGAIPSWPERYRGVWRH